MYHLCLKTSFFTIHDVFQGRTKDDVLSVAGYGALILSPEERPVVEILEMVGLAEEKSRSHISWYE